MSKIAKGTKRITAANDIVRWRPKPTLSVDAEDLPEIKEWSVGKTYTMVVKAKMTEVRSSDDDEYADGDGYKRPTSARFRIVSVKEAGDKY